MTIDEIRELIDLAHQTGVAELEVERGGDRVRIRRSPTNQEIILQTIPQAGPPLSSNPHTIAPAGRAPEPVEDEALVYVKSPIVGTYYDAPSPGAAPFVNVGDEVKVGQVLCIIESMKLMNEIESEISGVVVQKLVQNSQTVEYGEALMAVRPS